MESGVSWLRVAKDLAERYDVIMPDARVHGRSAGGETGFSPEILAADVVALINALKLDRPILIGRSNGAITAFLIATDDPPLVRALILEDPPAGGRPAPAVRPEVLTGNNWFQEWLTWLQRLKGMTHAERVASAAARWPHGMPIPQDEPLWGEVDRAAGKSYRAMFTLFAREDAPAGFCQAPLYPGSYGVY
jgi:pimeloyl-ACP methyl ester carboxylesterase